MDVYREGPDAGPKLTGDTGLVVRKHPVADGLVAHRVVGAREGHLVEGTLAQLSVAVAGELLASHHRDAAGPAPQQPHRRPGADGRQDEHRAEGPATRQ